VKKFIFSILFIYLTVLIGCAHLRDDYNGPDKGMVIVTLTGSQKSYITIITLRLRTKDKSASGGVIYIPHGIFGQTPCDFEKDTYHGFVKVLKLKPGETEVFNFALFENLGLAQYDYSAKKDFSIPFVVKEGKTIYTGEYWFVSTKWRFGYITLSDQSGRDIPLAIKKEPTISADKVKVQIPDVEKLGNPLFRPRQEIVN